MTHALNFSHNEIVEDVYWNSTSIKSLKLKSLAPTSLFSDWTNSELNIFLWDENNQNM